MRALDPSFYVAPQLTEVDVARAAEAGVGTIINNRPDGEDAGAAPGAVIRVAAERAGLSYHAIPVTGAGFGAAQIDATQAALDAAAGGGRPVLAYCRSGTRSTYLWALTRARAGADPDALMAAAAGAGHDLSGIAMMLRSLHAAGGAAADGAERR